MPTKTVEDDLAGVSMLMKVLPEKPAPDAATPRKRRKTAAKKARKSSKKARS
jgi:hypothetical protein